jgi:hypothetical protein
VIGTLLGKRLCPFQVAAHPLNASALGIKEDDNDVLAIGAVDMRWRSAVAILFPLSRS